MNSIRSVVASATLLAAIGAAPRPAAARTYFPEKFTCPISDEKFEADVTGSYTSWGQRPDGRS